MNEEEAQALLKAKNKVSGILFTTAASCHDSCPFKSIFIMCLFLGWCAAVPQELLARSFSGKYGKDAVKAGSTAGEEEDGDGENGGASLSVGSQDVDANALSLEMQLIRDKKAAPIPDRVTDAESSKYSWGRESNMLFNYDMNEASVMGGGGVPMDDAGKGKNTGIITPRGLRYNTIDNIAKYAGVLPHELPGNPFDIVAEMPTSVVTFLLTPADMPGIPHKEDDRMIAFERKMLANGELSELAVARKQFATLDERQRVGLRPPPRTLSTLPRTTSSAPVPSSELAHYKQGLGSRLTPGMRALDATGTPYLPGPKGRRHVKAAVELIDNVVTNAAYLAHGTPHPESFSFPRLHEVAQRDLHLHMSTRVQVFADPRRKFAAAELTGLMKNFDAEGAAEETSKPLHVMQARGDLAAGLPSGHIVHPGLKYNPPFLSQEDAESHWGLTNAMNPHRRTMDAVSSCFGGLESCW